jgi:GTPase SAR1 family protein
MEELILNAISTCIKTRDTYLDIGKCGLNDDSFIENKQINNALKKCSHVEILILSNEFKDWYPSKEKWELRKNRKDHDANILGSLPNAIRELKNLKLLMAGGDMLQQWAIKDLDFLGELKALETLILDFNEIESIEPLRELANLKYLNIGFNKVLDLSPLEKLSNLVSLNISNNFVVDISPLKRLKILQYLYLGHNKITDLTSLSLLRNLQELYCDKNDIQSLEPVRNCIALKKISAHSNKISDLSPLQNLLSISYLDLRSNAIHNIEPLLGLITENEKIQVSAESEVYLKGISLNENPLNSPPIEIIVRGRRAIIKFFEELKIQGEDELYEAKLLIVGEGGAGKSTLARKLINEHSSMPKEEDTTKGIEIFRCSFPHHNSKDHNEFYLNIWDFGGQEIYHATHQFFLTRRSLYVLVDDTRKDDKTINDPSFNYWLQVCEIYGGPDSTLIIVQNEKDDRSKDIDLAGMKSRFENLKEKYRTNLLNNRGLTEVKKGIQFYAINLPLVGQKLPRQWVIIREELGRLSFARPYITLSKFLNLCTKHSISEKDRALNLSSYLHDLGVFLHFQNDPILKHTVIL